MQYPYAVIDGNEATDQFRLAHSCHRTATAAKRAAERANRGNPNARYYVIEWYATRWARLRPSPTPETAL